MAAFAGSAKARDLRTGSYVALSIDTETYPYSSLRLRGPVHISTSPDLVPDYVDAARRYLGEDAAQFLKGLAGREMIRIALRVEHATLAPAS